MSLLTEILDWSEKHLSLWQRDALRRLFTSPSGALGPPDYEDLCAILRAEHGIPDPLSRVASPLGPSHVPAKMVAGSTVVLLALRDLKDVNRIAPAQSLTFGPTGMTVIYGDNGSGKSGYSRVLKRACRAREAADPIAADAFDASAASRVPEAVFDIDIGGKAKTVKWKQSDKSAPDELSAIAVFDSHCARSYLDDEKDVAFLPYGLGMVEALAGEVMPAVAGLLDAEIRAVDVDVAPFGDLVGETPTGRLCGALSAATDSNALTAAGTLSPSDADRLGELTRVLSAPDPATRASELRLAARRFSDLAEHIGRHIKVVDHDAIAHAEAFDDEVEAVLAAQAAAAEAFRAGEPLLRGTGETAWRALFAAAERYSTSAAYPESPFPKAESDALCLLCQQRLDDGAAARLKRFQEFVQKDVAKQAVGKSEDRRRRRDKLAAAALDFGIVGALGAELAASDPAVCAVVLDAEGAVEARRGWLVARFDAHDWKTSAPAGLLDPVPRLLAKALALGDEALSLERASDPIARTLLTGELKELRVREALSVRLHSALDLIKRMRLKSSLEKCRSTIKTRAVSEKAKEFASSQVTGSLKKALDLEFAALGVGHIKTTIKERAQQGAMKHKLVLDVPRATDLSKVLSEGEQRSIAIGAFLAELSLAGHGGGIVFDDPVSSLDHHRRHAVAERLVGEAGKRQVIVFTHDTVFLGELQALLDRSSIAYEYRYLEWRGKNPGHVVAGLPWDHQSSKQRIKVHQQNQKDLAKAWGTYPNASQTAAMRREYSLLRATIERSVEDVVLNGVIWRYRGYIEPGKLDGVAVLTQHECNEIKRLTKKCHTVVDAHATASGAAHPPPTPAELSQDLSALQAVLDSIKAKRP